MDPFKTGPTGLFATALSDIILSLVFCYPFCRIYLALSDISCVLLSFLSDISSPVGHILLFVTIFVGHV